MPVVTCALALASLSGMDGMKSVVRRLVLVMSVDVEVAGSGLCIEPRDDFKDLKNFLIIARSKRKISRLHKRSTLPKRARAIIEVLLNTFLLVV